MARSILIFFIFLQGASAFSQSDCQQTMNQATAEFEAGRFYNLPSILKPCLDRGFSKEQKVRAYMLLTQSYLVLNDPIAAESSYLKLLEVDPEYVANPDRDPVDVYYLSKKFTTTPVFTPSLRAGINTSLVRSIYAINTSASSTNTKNQYKIGYQLGGALDWNIDEQWSLCLGIAYSRKSFKIDQDNTDNGMNWSFTEKQNWIDIPLYMKYSDHLGKVRPFAYAGISANLLLSANLSASVTDYNSPSTGVQQVSQGPDVSITYKRKFFNSSLVLGGGVKYKVGKNFLYVDARYLAGLNNITKNIYTDPNGQFDKLLTNYQFASDFFRLDNLSLSIGFIQPLYEPRKRKPAVTGLLQKLGLKKRAKK